MCLLSLKTAITTFSRNKTSVQLLEHELGAKCVIDMNDNQTVIHHPAEESHG